MTNNKTRMVKKIKQLWHFLTKGIWSMRLSDFSARKAMSLKAIRILVLSIRGLYEDKIQQRAAAITLYCLLSIVPALALGFGIAKGFGYDKFLEENIVKPYLKERAHQLAEASNVDSASIYKGYSEGVDEIITFSSATLARTKGGLLAGIGIILLFWSVMKVLSNVESSFNDIWQVKKGRLFLRKYSDYISIMIISPIFFISAVAVDVFLNQKLNAMTRHVEVVHLVSPVLFFLLKTIPYLLIIVLFTLVYVIMPNVKVKWKYGIFGGIVAGALFQIVQMAYIHFQIGVSSNNAIYGSFAAIPLFLIWMQISWLIVLFGAKITFAAQNSDMFEFETEAINMSNYSRKILAMVVTHRMIKNFNHGEKPWMLQEISQNLHIPIRILTGILSDLVRTRILSEVLIENQRSVGYQPAHNVDHFTVNYIVEQIDKLGEHYPIENKSEIALKLKTINEKMYRWFELSEDNKLIKDL